ncbi:hypothetical protein [Sporisorium scitamineum]|uniref:WW domain-containing protein n=1 Tax=Sporisorium scitamineum TaxID=49012 RepID=A0A0F7SC24_9BASI|nr:hypothetical protein [Sporisorium scitamineum]
MKVALLCAIVFGALSVAASSSQYVADEHFVQRSHGSAKANSGTKNEKPASKHQPKHQRDLTSQAGHAEHLFKRVDGPAFLEIGDNLASVLKKSSGGETVINHYSGADAAASHFRGGPPPPYYHSHYPPPYHGGDPATASKLEGINSKLDHLHRGQQMNAQQIELMQELQAKEMEKAGAASAAAAAKPKRGYGKGAMALMLAGGALGGWGLTKVFDTKPADSTTGYNPGDMAAMQAAGGAAPGTAPVDGAPQPSAGGQADQANPFKEGPYKIPGTGLVWVVDQQNQVHVVDPVRQVEVSPPPGWNPYGSSGGAADGSTAGGDGADAAQQGARATQQVPGASGGAPTTQAGDSSTSGVDAAQQGARATQQVPGASGGAPTTQAGDSSTSGAGQQGDGGQVAQGSGASTAQNAAQQAPQDASANADLSGSGDTKPVWDPNVKRYWVVGPKNVRYYIDDSTGFLLNSETNDVSDPRTGKIVISGKELMAEAEGDGQGQGQGSGGDTPGSQGGRDGGASQGPGQDGAGAGGRMQKRGESQGQTSGSSNGFTTGSQGQDDGNGGGNRQGGFGRMQKRSLRHRKHDKRSYTAAAFQASNPALREQAMLAMAQGSQGGAPVAAAAKKAGVGKTIAKAGVGIAALVAVVVGLSDYAHPQPKGTTQDNPYGLTPTNICDVYGEPIIRDFRGVLWNKSTYSRVDLNNPGQLYQCPQSDQAQGDGVYAGAGYGTQPQKRDLHERGLRDKLIEWVRPSVIETDVSSNANKKLLDEVKKDVDKQGDSTENHSLEKRQMKYLKALMPSMTASGTMAVAGTVIITAIWLHHVHEQKIKALQEQWNSQYHSAGEAASSVGNAISTGANGQLFNPITGSLILVDPNTQVYYDSSTGEQVNPKTGMPLRYGDGDDGSKKQKEQQVQLPIDRNGNLSGDSPEVQQAMAQWNAMSPQQQQQVLAQYGDAADQILNSPDPNAALQAWNQQHSQALQQQFASQQQLVPQQQQQFAPQQLAPQQLAPQQLAPQQLAPQQLAPQQQQMQPAAGGASNLGM